MTEQMFFSIRPTGASPKEEERIITLLEQLADEVLWEAQHNQPFRLSPGELQAR